MKKWLFSMLFFLVIACSLSGSEKKVVKFFNAVASLDKGKVQYFLNKNSDFSKKVGVGGSTPLHLLAKMPVVMHLSSNNTLVTKKLLRTLKLSVVSEITDLFLAEGCDTTKTDDEGYTPLLLALMNKNKVVAEKIIAYENTLEPELRSVTKADKKGNEPLLIAITAGLQELVLPLYKLGASLDGKTPSGSTVLHEVLKQKWFDLAAQLIRLGAPIFTVDSEKKYPIEMLKNVSDVRLLIKALFWFSETLTAKYESKSYAIYTNLLKKEPCPDLSKEELSEKCLNEIKKLTSLV